MVIEREAENFVAHRMEFAEKAGEPGSGFAHGFGRDAVDFAAIAGGKDQRFFENATRTQFFSGTAGLVVGERDAFADFDRGGAVI